MPAADAPNSGDRRNGTRYAQRAMREWRFRETGEGTFPGCEIVGDDLEFVKACEKYRRENRRPFPTFTEILKVAKALGYRKVAAANETIEILET